MLVLSHNYDQGKLQPVATGLSTFRKSLAVPSRASSFFLDVLEDCL